MRGRGSLPRDDGDRFYMISTGRLEVLREGKRLAILAGGDAFGELALLRGERRNATVRTLEPCELLAVDQVDFLDLLYTHPSLVPPFARLVTHRLFEIRRRFHVESAGGIGHIMIDGRLHPLDFR